MGNHKTQTQKEIGKKGTGEKEQQISPSTFLERIIQTAKKEGTNDDGSTNDDPDFRGNSSTSNTQQAVSDTHESRVSPY